RSFRRCPASALTRSAKRCGLPGTTETTRSTLGAKTSFPSGASAPPSALWRAATKALESTEVWLCGWSSPRPGTVKDPSRGRGRPLYSPSEKAVSESNRLQEQLEAMALKYLERHDATAKHLKMVLARKVRAAAFEGYPPATLQERIDELVNRYQRSGIVDDSRYAAQAVRRFRARGLSKTAIVHRLTAKGVAAGTI